MTVIDEHLQQANLELQRAREALETGNDGTARTAARRAAGSTLAALRYKFPDRNYDTDVMRQLRNLMDDATVPVEVRESAERLQARVTEQFISPFSTDPIDDTLIIVKYVHKCLGKIQ